MKFLMFQLSFNLECSLDINPKTLGYRYLTSLLFRWMEPCPTQRVHRQQAQSLGSWLASNMNTHTALSRGYSSPKEYYT